MGNPLLDVAGELHARRAAALANARLAVELEREWYEEQKRRWLDRVFACMMLARDLDTCRALLRGERVHPSRINRNWLAHFTKTGAVRHG